MKKTALSNQRDHASCWKAIHLGMVANRKIVRAAHSYQFYYVFLHAQVIFRCLAENISRNIRGYFNLNKIYSENGTSQSFVSYAEKPSAHHFGKIKK